MSLRCSTRHRDQSPAFFGRVAYLLALLLLSGTADAQVISWSYDSSGTVGGDGAGDHSGIGEEAGVVLAGNWTNSFPSNLTRDLQDNAGASTLLDIAPSAPFTFSLQGTHPGQDADGSWNKEMLNGYLNAGSSSTPTASSIDITQIPYASYDIYVYFGSDDSTRSGTVTDDMTTYDFNVLDNMIAGANAQFTQTTSTGGASPEANYAIFSGLSGSTQTITVEIPDFGGIAGFQLVNTGAVAPVFDWKADAGGDFSVGMNWVGDIAPGTDSDVRFRNVITETRTVTIDEDVQLNSITFDNIGDGDYFLVAESTQAITLTGDANLVTFGRHWVRAEIAGSNVNTLGNGDLILDAANSFSSLNVNETSATITNADAIPTGAPITIENGGAVRYFGSDNGFFFDNGTGLDPNSILSFTSAVSLLDGDSFIDFNDGANASITGVISGDGSLGVQNANVTVSTAQTYNGVTNTNAGAVLTVTDAGTLGSTIGGTNLFEDSIVVLDGVSVGDEDFGVFAEGQLRLTSATLGSTPGGALVVLDENLDGETHKIASTGASSISHNINAGPNDDGGHYEIRAESGTLELSGLLSAADDTEQRIYVFSGSGNIVVDEITDASVDANGNFAASSLNTNVSAVKRGDGTLTIDTGTDANDDYWFGTTTIEEGTLEVLSQPGANGPDGELRSTVTVNENATFDVDHFSTYNLIPIAPYSAGIGGGGTVLAQTLGVFESSTVTPGDSVGTLKVQGNVNLTYFDSNEAVVPNTGSLDFELGDDASLNAVDNAENDLISVSGTLAINTASSGDRFVVNVEPVDGAFDTVNNYTLIQAGSRTGGATASNFTVNFVDSTGTPVASRYTATVALTSTSVDLNVGGGALNLTWSGPNGGDWDMNTTNNWNSGAQTFFNLDTVAFDGGSGSTVHVAENVSPGTMTVSSSAYTFEGNDINAVSVTVGGNGTASFSNSVGGDVVVADTGTVAGTGTFKHDVTVESGGTLRMGGTTMPGSVGVISWNVDNNSTVGGDGAGSLPALSEEAGVELVGGWTNDWPDFDYTDLRDDSGNTTTLDIAPFSNSGAWALQFSHPGADSDGTWSMEMLNGYLNSGSPNGADGAGVVLTEIPYALYDIIAYFNSDNDTRTGTVSDGTSTYSFKAAGLAGSFGGDGNATLSEADAATTTADTANYAVFSGLTGATQTITVDIPDFGGLAGFQIIGDPSTVAPSGETMFVLGDVSLEAGSTASFNIASSGFNDRLDIAGNLDVANGFVLEVLLDGSVSAASLSVGDSWNLFDFASATGAFDDMDFLLPTLSSGLVWDTSNLLVDGVLAVLADGLPGDFNDDGVVDAADYAVYRNNLGASVTLPNDDGLGGPISTAHYALWRSNYGATSLVTSASESAAPEPGSMALLLGVLAVGVVAQRRL